MVMVKVRVSDSGKFSSGEFYSKRVFQQDRKYDRPYTIRMR